MKTKLTLIALALTGITQAASTIAFSGTTNYATNFLDGSGVATSKLIWGIVVDTTGNGFAEGQYKAGFSLAAGSGTNAGAPVQLSTSSGFTDDYLIVSGNIMNLTTNTTDGGTAGINRITGLNSFSYAPGMEGGDTYKVIWFDATALGGTSAAGLKYGTFKTTTLNTIPADPTPSINYQAAFAGADAPKTMEFALIPETSTALLGALGALGLLRRRR